MSIEVWKIESRKRGHAAHYTRYVLRIDPRFVQRGDLVASGHGNLPDWSADDPVNFMAAADLHERVNGAACRGLLIALPRELDKEDLVNLVENYIQSDLPGKAYVYAIHNPHGTKSEAHNPHAHILYSDRMADEHQRDEAQFFARFNPKDPAKGGCRKDSGGKSPIQLRIGMKARKDQWSKLQNAAIKRS